MIAAALVLSGLLAANSAFPRPPFESEIDAAIASAAGVYPVPKDVVLAVISVESAFDPHAVSRAGAVGLMQLMPATARRAGIARDELANPRRNILGGVRLLAVLLRHYDGDVVSSLVAYNARPRRLFARLPQNGETPEYVRRVLSRTRWYGGSSR